jgi:hypothetical protein
MEAVPEFRVRLFGRAVLGVRNTLGTLGARLIVF